MQFTAAADGRTRTTARSRPSLPRGVAQRAQMDDGKLLFSDGGGGGVLVGRGEGGELLRNFTEEQQQRLMPLDFFFFPE